MGRRIPIVERFHSKYVVDKETGCWNWVSAVDGHGYSKIGETAADGKRRTIAAYKWIAEQTYGSIPTGYEPDHLCENKLCVNPAHLEIVTREENQRRRHLSYTSKRKHYAFSHTCFKGHEWSPETTINKKDGTRRCRICTRISQKEWVRQKRTKKVLDNS